MRCYRLGNLARWTFLMYVYVWPHPGRARLLGACGIRMPGFRKTLKSKWGQNEASRNRDVREWWCALLWEPRTHEMLRADWTKQGSSEQHQSCLCLIGPPPTSSCLVLFDWCGLTHTSLCIYPMYKMFGLGGGMVLCYDCYVCVRRRADYSSRGVLLNVCV